MRRRRRRRRRGRTTTMHAFKQKWQQSHHPPSHNVTLTVFKCFAVLLGPAKAPSTLVIAGIMGVLRSDSLFEVLGLRCLRGLDYIAFRFKYTQHV